MKFENKNTKKMLEKVKLYVQLNVNREEQDLLKKKLIKSRLKFNFW